MAREHLYLASGSPRRRQLLQEAGIAYELYVGPVDEEALTAAYNGPLELLGAFLARAKATAALRSLRAGGRPGLVLAADTTVLLEGQSLAKPRDAEEAVRMLQALRGREHTVATGVALAGPSTSAMVSATSSTRVRMRAYGDDEVAAYVASGDPLDKAGAYSIQHPQFQPVGSLAGCHLGVIGLPLCLVDALVNGAALPPSQHCYGEGDRAGCPWSAHCTPPYPQPQVIHHEPTDWDGQP
jgi:septum formation protein